MHFRHILISGLMVGAALFLPDNVFADRNEQSGSLKATAQVDIKVNKADVQVGAGPKSNAGESGENLGKPAEKVNTNKASLKANANASEVTAKAKVQGEKDSLKLSSKSAYAPGKLKQSTEEQKVLPDHVNAAKSNGKKIGHQKVKDQKDADLVMKDDEGSQRNDRDLELKVQKTEPTKGNDSPVLKTDSDSRSFAGEENEHDPVGSERVDQLTTQPQRTNQNHAGGSSTDRLINGGNLITMLDKWFMMNSSYEVDLVHPFVSKLTWLYHQWVNAPPSPPPKASSFI